MDKCLENEGIAVRSFEDADTFNALNALNALEQENKERKTE